MFSRDLTIRVGETIERDGFAYADLLLAENPTLKSPLSREWERTTHKVMSALHPNTGAG